MENTLEFYKYQGTGNDFVMVDNRDLQFPKDTGLIAKLCDRRFGIGADGLLLLENDDTTDFKMVYYNADGNESTMCGNGGRCIVAFAHFLDIFEERCQFMAVDGLHEAEICNSLVKLKMIDALAPQVCEGGHFVNTGSPHFVKFLEDVEQFDVFAEGKKIRNSEPFKTEGVNVDFAQESAEGELFVRTYERGVEDETYSCGTGVTAAALTHMDANGGSKVSIRTLGGPLTVYAEKYEDGFRNVWLEGPAKQVFRGKISL